MVRPGQIKKYKYGFGAFTRFFYKQLNFEGLDLWLRRVVNLLRP